MLSKTIRVSNVIDTEKQVSGNIHRLFRRIGRRDMVVGFTKFRV